MKNNISDLIKKLFNIKYDIVFKCKGLDMKVENENDEEILKEIEKIYDEKNTNDFNNFKAFIELFTEQFLNFKKDLLFKLLEDNIISSLVKESSNKNANDEITNLFQNLKKSTQNVENNA